MGGTCSIYEEMIKEYKILGIKLEGKISLGEI
jgi:hypothetical protein